MELSVLLAAAEAEAEAEAEPEPDPNPARFNVQMVSGLISTLYSV
jgi:hypothetical protein